MKSISLLIAPVHSLFILLLLVPLSPKEFDLLFHVLYTYM